MRVTGAHVYDERVDARSAFGIRYFYQTLDVPCKRRKSWSPFSVHSIKAQD
jgi:hypothetical protein